MCGIAGLWRFKDQDPDDIQRLIRMASTLDHRGPDDRGYLFLETATGQHRLTRDEETGQAANLLLAHRRLSIIDVSTDGWQPMHNETGDLFLVFNGELYNYVELRAELQALGHTFASRSDSEVILHAYEAWGVDCCTRFNGMWAYVLWDQRSRKLICSRDRFGIKPFFHAMRNDRFLFGSEIKAVLAGLDEGARPDPAMIANFLIPAWRPRNDLVFFQGVDELPPAHQLVVTEQGARQHRYWNYDHQSEPYDYHDPEGTFRALFADSVRLRLRADVPVSILLSGGLDSTAIAAFASAPNAARRMKAFTSINPGSRFDEQATAGQTAARFHLEHFTVNYNPESLIQDMADITRSQDLPPFSTQVLPRWQLLRKVAEHGKVVLEGQGADELLGGYVSLHIFPYLRDEVSACQPLRIRAFLRQMHHAWTMLNPNLHGHANWMRPFAYYRNMHHIRNRARAMLCPDLARMRHPGLPETPDPPRLPDHLARALHRDHAVLLLPALLRFGDSISMAHSVESRLPFMDYRLVEFTFGLSYAWKIQDGWSKAILRRALAPELPEAIRTDRVKVGFTAPVSQWLRPWIQEAIEPLLLGPGSRTRDLYQDRTLEKLLEDCRNDDWRAIAILFRALGLELWFREYLSPGGA